MAWSRQTFWFKLNFLFPKNESVLNILVHFLEQFQRFPRGSKICKIVLEYTFRQQENLAHNQKCQARFWPLCNKILILLAQYERTCKMCSIILAKRKKFCMYVHIAQNVFYNYFANPWNIQKNHRTHFVSTFILQNVFK